MIIDMELFSRQYVTLMCEGLTYTRTQQHLKQAVVYQNNKYGDDGWFTDEEMDRLYKKDPVYIQVYTFVRDNKHLFVEEYDDYIRN